MTITKSVSGLIWNSTENKYIDTTSYDIKINNSDDPLTVVNTPLGSISVTKTVTGSYTTTTDTYPITIMKDNKYVNSNSQLVDDDPQLTVTAGQTWTFDNLPVGTYTVTEGSVSLNGYEITTTYSVNGSPVTTARASVTKGTTAEVGITNHYRNAQLVIKKTVTGPALADALEKITFTIEDVTTGITDAEKTETLTISGSTLTTTETYGSVTLTSAANGIKPDHTYKVTETIDDTLANYKWKRVATTIVTGTGTNGTTKDATVTLTNGDTSSGEIDFANTYGDLIDVSGTKTWRVSSGVTTVNTNITLKLERTAKPGTDSSTWETVTATPTWSGNTYTFSRLDKYNDSSVEYEYRVSEVSFIIDGVTYTVDSDGIATPSDNTKPVMKMTQSGNDFTNEELTTVQVTKTWNGGSGSWPKDYTVEMTLKSDISGTASAVTTTAAANGDVNPATLNNTKSSTTWTNLPKFKSDGTAITYTVDETRVLYNEVAVATLGMFTITGDGTVTNGATTFDNSPKTTERHATKTWIDKNNESGQRPGSITFTLSATYDNSGTVTTIDLSTYGITNAVQTITPDASTGDWPTANWTGLPQYTNEGALITYDVNETAVQNYTQTGKTETDGTFAFTNTLNETNLKIVKVDADTITPLTGAEFSLEKETTPNTWTAVTTFTVDNTAGVTISNLTDGSYRLTETQAPAGYNMMSDAITFTISNGVVNRPTGGTVTYTPAQAAVADDAATTDVNEARDAVPATFTVGNTPGVELPSTGGTGTTIYTLTGLTLLLGAALWLFLRRRREQN